MEETKKELEKILKGNEEYENYSVEYILLDKKNPENSFAIACDFEDIVKIDINSHEISSVASWAYNIDEDIFGYLEKNYEIGYMNMNSHFGIWENLNQWYPEDVENKKGMQKYLKYCKDNKITKEVIEKAIKCEVSIDAMKFYEKDKKSLER